MLCPLSHDPRDADYRARVTPDPMRAAWGRADAKHVAALTASEQWPVESVAEILADSRVWRHRLEEWATHLAASYAIARVLDTTTLDELVATRAELAPLLSLLAPTCQAHLLVGRGGPVGTPGCRRCAQVCGSPSSRRRFFASAIREASAAPAAAHAAHSA